MSHKNPLERIEALPLPVENREEILSVARNLPEEQQAQLLDRLSKRLVQFAEQSLAHQERIVAAAEEDMHQLHSDLRAVDADVERSQRKDDQGQAESNLQQAA